MVQHLRKYLSMQRPIELIYINRYGKTSKRTVRVLEIKDRHIKAFCLTRRAPRVFLIENILAFVPADDSTRGA